MRIDSAKNVTIGSKIGLPNDFLLSPDGDNWLRLRKGSDQNLYRNFAAQDLYAEGQISCRGIGCQGQINSNSMVTSSMAINGNLAITGYITIGGMTLWGDGEGLNTSGKSLERVLMVKIEK